MSLDNNSPPTKPINDSQTSVGGTTSIPKICSLKPPEQTLKCPRCDSPNTKFCYYNNYSLTQPRHFCKTCRRYWTKGGALRNVPIGGGCRKKKTRSTPSRDLSLEIGGLSLFNGLSPPAMDFQLNGLNQFSSSSSINPPPFMNLDSLRLSFPLMKQDHSRQLYGGLANFQEIGINTNNLASSIESLSSINQDFHWKLQQQRMASLYGVGSEIDQQNQIVIDSQAQKLQPILFQNLEIPKPSHTSMTNDLRGDVGSLETEWFFDGNYARVDVDPARGIDPSDGHTVPNHENGSMNNWNNEIQGWNDFNEQYNALP